MIRFSQLFNEQRALFSWRSWYDYLRGSERRTKVDARKEDLQIRPFGIRWTVGDEARYEVPSP